MVAYISRLTYPDPSANSLQTILQAAALAALRENTWLFVHDLNASEREIRRGYGIEGSPLGIWRLHTRRWPGVVYGHGMLRFLTYNTACLALLSLHPLFRGTNGGRRVLFVRSRLEILYWGLVRPYLRWMRDWRLVCEVHDLPEEPGRARRLARALRNYDLVICVNQALREDLARRVQGGVQVQVVPLCSGLERLPTPPEAVLPEDRVVIGYFGTIDLAHGIDTAIQALDCLPEGEQGRFVLRLTGRVREDAREWVERGVRSGRVELCDPVPYAQVAAEIDRCHLALVPAGRSLHATRYRSPLKVFDAMLRGKPILAADAPCHRELLHDGRDAVLYRSEEPQDLAHKILHLHSDPRLVARIARNAWEASQAYTYPARARTLLRLMEAPQGKETVPGTANG